MKDFVIKLMHRQSLVEIDIIVHVNNKADAEHIGRQFNTTHTVRSIRERK
jgi:hypothetical protein